MFTDYQRDWLNIAGILLAIVGFGVTIWQAWAARRAAEQARDQVRGSQTIASLATAVAIVEEIKRLQTAGAWPVVVDRYSTLRGCLIEIQGSSDAKLAGSIRKLKTSEKEIAEAMRDGTPLDPVKMNEILNTEADKLKEILVGVKWK